MDIKALDNALQAILKKQEELKGIEYNNPKYDDLEEELHTMEDDFQSTYGEYLEEALQDVHDELCPDNDVLLPIAYIGEGIYVEVDDYPGKETRLLLEPNPTRITIKVGKEKQETVWQAK